jgi:peptidoglycan/xylan/chitin deacetylase (PgdA/CDA1 family)
VLMYHAFGDRPAAEDPHCLFVSSARLEHQLGHLFAHGWEPVNLSGYLDRLDGGSGPARPFLVTIDDGYLSVDTVAAPVFARAGICPVLLVPAGLLGAEPGWMAEGAAERLLNAEQVRALHDRGWDIGVHGFDHSTLVGLDDRELVHQTVAAKEAMAEVIGRPPRAFAYPGGQFDARALAAVAAAGYDVGFAVHRDEGRFATSRVDVSASDTNVSFRVKLLPRYRALWRLSEPVRVLRPAIRAVMGAARPTR